jgi:hypothetical protein
MSDMKLKANPRTVLINDKRISIDGGESQFISVRATVKNGNVTVDEDIRLLTRNINTYFDKAPKYSGSGSSQSTTTPSSVSSSQLSAANSRPSVSSPQFDNSNMPIPSSVLTVPSPVQDSFETDIIKYKFNKTTNDKIQNMNEQYTDIYLKEFNTSFSTNIEANLELLNKKRFVLNNFLTDIQISLNNRLKIFNKLIDINNPNKNYEETDVSVSTTNNDKKDETKYSNHLTKILEKIQPILDDYKNNYIFQKLER